jgi:hypothetical protein
MAKGKVDLKLEYWVPGGPVLFVVVAIGFSVFFFLNSLFLLGGSIILGAILLSTIHYRLELDFVARTSRHYLFLFGIRIGPKASFEKVQYIFLRENPVSKSFYYGAMYANNHIRLMAYYAYLKFSENDKLRLMRCDTKAELLRRIVPIAEDMGVSLVDMTEKKPVVLIRAK